ncbi:hypothetical protein FOFC_17421 [Fusarium oxysporum]|nr:hypothetical protein FOFC_17421 [Fusarium oxysporum]
MADHPCHTCRKRRVQCDGGYPHCDKCTLRGIECLGYGQFLMWTGAVAVRGRLAGQTSSAAACHGQHSAVAKRRTIYQTKALETKTIHVTDQSVSSSKLDLQTSDVRSLVDPLFQGMSESQRRYFDYYSHRVCQDLISHDFSNANPFRNLLPLTSSHPILRQVIIAASAAHMFNQTTTLAAASDPSQRFQAPNNIRIDALVAKHKALQIMPSAIQNIITHSIDIILAAALFLVNVELLESGKRSWKPHLEGAARILSMTQPLTLLDESLKDYIMSDCIVYSILSLTFNPSAPNLQNHLESCQILSILDKTANSYLCCPPELLNILLMASQLLDSSEDGVTASSCAALLEQARSVDLDSWAYKLHDQNTIRSRFLAGLAHQIAACLYVLQVVPALDNSMDRGTTHTLLEGLYNTLSQIPDNDPNFKATAWPSFVLGATTESQETQSWVIDRLKRMAVVFPWGFIYSAVDTLQVLWRLSEKQRVAASWVQTLRQLDVNFLIV